MHKILALFIIVFFITNNSYGQRIPQLAALDTLMEKAHKLGVFNGNILIAENGKVIYKKAIGKTDLTGKTRLTEDYRFHIGSIAKEFNTVGIMMLKEQGRLNLDDQISKYLPELPAWAEKIRIRNLLQYTSGIPQSKWNEIKGDEDNLRVLKNITALNFEPGTRYDYNNNDVFLQRRIIEKITNMTFKSFVTEKMLKPCGIKNGIVDPGIKEKLMAISYNNQGEQDDLKRELSGWTALNLQDFYKWSECINSFRLISPASTQELMIAFSPGNQTGLGSGNMEGEKVVRHVHDGTSYYYQALLVSTPVTTIILMTNNRQDNLYPISRSIQSILEGKPYAAIKVSFRNSFQKELKKMNGKEILGFYEKKKIADPDLYSFESESLLNEIGYFLLGQKKIEDAIIVFTYNTRLFPNSGNLYDSLGEAYYAQGNKEKSMYNYTKTLELDPGLESAKQMLTKLKAELKN